MKLRTIKMARVCLLNMTIEFIKKEKNTLIRVVSIQSGCFFLHRNSHLCSIFLGLGGIWGSRSLSQTTIEREVNSQLAQV
jgi:hypothetical protein